MSCLLSVWVKNQINQPTDVGGKPFHLLKHKYYQPNLTNTCAKCLSNLLDSSKERGLLMPSAQVMDIMGLSENRVPQIQWCIIKFPLNRGDSGYPMVSPRLPHFRSYKRHPARPGGALRQVSDLLLRKKADALSTSGRRLHFDSVSGGQLPSRFQAIFNQFPPSISGQSWIFSCFIMFRSFLTHPSTRFPRIFHASGAPWEVPPWPPRWCWRASTGTLAWCGGCWAPRRLQNSCRAAIPKEGTLEFSGVGKWDFIVIKWDL